MRYLPIFVVPIARLLLVQACLPDVSDTVTAKIVVPYGSAGTVSIVDVQEGSEYGRVFLDENGTAIAKFSQPKRMLVARVSNLHVRELSDGGTVASGDLVYELPIPETPDAKKARVVFSADRLFAWSASGGDVEAYRRWLKARDDALAYGRPELRGALLAEPYDPEKQQAPESITPELFAYFMCGGYSELAAMLAREMGSSSARLHSLTLLSYGIRDAVDGTLDRSIHGEPIHLSAGSGLLPPSYMKEFLAQAIRRFVSGDRNQTGVTVAAIRDLLDAMSTDADRRYGPAGKPMDVSGPATQITLPAAPAGVDVATINGTVPVECRLRDTSTIVSADIRAYRNAHDITDIAIRETDIQHSDGPGDGASATVRAELATTEVSDGELVLVCVGLDRWHNATTASDTRVRRRVRIDNTAATVAVAAPGDGESIAGTAQVTCLCHDDTGDVRCDLAAPTGEDVSCAEPEPAGDGTGATLRVCSIQTTGFAEGPIDVTCTAQSEGFDSPTVATARPVVDNREEGRVGLVATLETRLTGGRLVARAMSGAGPGRIVSVCNQESGCVLDGALTSLDIPISDNYVGDLLIELYVPNWEEQASYISGTTNTRVQISPGSARLMALVENYRPGQTLSAVLSGLSTLDACYVLGAIENREISYEEAKGISEALIGSHFSDRPIDFRHAVPVDLTAEPASALDDPALSALAHMGVAYVGKRAAESLDPHMKPVASHLVWGRLCDDLHHDLRLNGRGRDGTVTLLDNNRLPLDGDTFRHDLASGIDAFVSTSEPSEGSPAALYNASHITRSDLACPGCLYARISTNASALFDPSTENEPLRPFDREDPVAECEKPSASGLDVVASSVPLLDCRCRDNLGVSSFFITSPREWASSDKIDDTDQVLAVNLSVADIQELRNVSGDYSLDISLTCYDEVNNQSTASVSVNVDQTPPVVQIQTTDLGEPVNGSYVVTSSPLVVTFVARDAFGIASAQLNGKDAEQTGGSTYSGTITPPAGRAVLARAEARDRAGHTADDTAQFFYATGLPTVEFTSPVANMTYGATLNVVATVVDPSFIPLERVTILEPPEFRIAAVTLAGHTATVSLRGTSSAPLSAMAAAGAEPRVCISATNVAGLTSEETCVEGLTVDIESPTGQIASPKPGTTLTTSTIDVRAVVDDPTGVTSVTVDGLPAIYSAEAEYWSRTLTSLPEGEKHIEVRATDRLRNHGIVDSVLIDVDTLPPTVRTELRRTSLVGPLIELARPVSGQIWLLIYADDRTGINGIDIELPGSDASDAIGDPVPLPACDVALCAAYPIDTKQLSVGGQSVQTRARDGQDTASDWHVLPLHVDQQPPTPVVTSHSDGQHVPFRHVILLGRLDDEYPAHGTVTVTTGVDTWSTITDTRGKWSVEIEIDKAGQVSISAIDGAGNATPDPLLMSLYVDSENPTVELTQPMGVMGCVGRTMTVSCSATDNVDAGLRVYFEQVWLAQYATGLPGTGYGTSSSVTLTDIATEHLVDAAGRVTITCGAVDGAGRRAQVPASIDFCRDVESPYLSSISPVDGSWLASTSTTLTGTARDHSGVAAVICNGTTIIPSEGQTTEAVAWSCANGQASDGGTVNSIGATDGLGNTTPLTELHNITLYADRMPPVVSVRLTDPMHSALGLTRAHTGGIRVVVAADDPRGFGTTPTYSVTVDAVVDLTSTCTHIVSSDGTHLDIECLADTSLLDDGPHNVAASVEDALQNRSIPADASVSFRSDNTAPIATVSAPRVVGTTTTEVSWDITEEVGLDLLKIFVCDEEVHADPAPPLSGSVSVPLQSNTDCPVRVYVKDGAAHDDTASTNVMCDRTAATIRLLKGGGYFPERRAEAQYASGHLGYPEDDQDRVYLYARDWSQVQTIAKSRYRLDLSAGNLPSFKLEAVDPYGPEDGGMRVHYRTLLDGVEKRTWSELTTNAEGAYVLPIAYQTLLPAGTPHQGNYVGRSVPESVHAIEFRVTDQVGNVSAEGEHLYRFHLVLHTPPMAVADCRLSPAIAEGTISAAVGEQPTLGAFLATGEDAAIMTARLLWDTGNTAQSLAPRDDAELVIDGLTAAWSMQRYAKRLVYRDGQHAWLHWTMSGACSASDEGWQNAAFPYGDSDNCKAGYRSVSDAQLDINTTTSMKPNGRVYYDGMLLTERGGAHAVAPEYEELELVAVVHDPHLRGATNERLALQARKVTYPAIGDSVGYAFTEYSGRDYHRFTMYDPDTGGMPWWKYRYWSEYDMLTNLSLSMAPVVAHADQRALPHESSPEVAELPNVDVHLLGSCAGNLSKSWDVEF